MGGRCGFCPLHFGTSLPPLPPPLLELIYQKEAEERSGSSLISGNHHPSSPLMMIRRNWVAIVQMIATTPFLRQTFFLKNWRKLELRKI